MKYPTLNRSIGRLIYLIILLINIYNFFQNIDLRPFNATSSLNIPYWAAYLLVFVPLIYQVIFNNKIGWYVIAFLLLVSLVQFIKDSIDKERPEDIIYVILIYAVIYLLFLVLYPRKKQTIKHKDDINGVT